MKKITVERVNDWDQRLAAVTSRHLRTASVWGESDCLLKVADAIEAVIGVDPAAGIRGKYKTEAGAAKLMRKRGFETVEDVIASMFDQTEGKLMAQRGDICIIEENGEIAAGYMTEYGAAIATPSGSAFRSPMEIARAYKVGR